MPPVYLITINGATMLTVTANCMASQHDDTMFAFGFETVDTNTNAMAYNT